MKNTASFAVLLLAILFPLCLQAQLSVQHISKPDEISAANGYFYTLPQTVFKIDVVIKADERMKGPYSDYARKMLGLEEVNNFDFTTYYISKVEITPLAKPDPAQLYFINPGIRDPKNPMPFNIKTSKEGFLEEINTLNLGEAGESRTREEILVFDYPMVGAESEGFYIPKNIATKTDTIIRRVAVDTALTEQTFYRTRIEEKSTEEMAVSALQKIESIRESKYKMITGFQETAYDAGTLQLMYEKLDRLENEYLDLFRGKSSTSYQHYTFYYTPDKKDKKNTQMLFKFSSGAGMSTGKSANGEGVSIELISENSAVNTDTDSPPAGTNGVVYRLPGQALVRVTYQDETLYEGHFTINQLGTCSRLPAQKFRADFYPKTGALKSLLLK